MTATWHYRSGGQESGPVPLERLQEMAAQGRLTPTDAVRPSDEDVWLPAESVSELADALATGSQNPGTALEELHDLDELNITFADERSAAPVVRSEHAQSADAPEAGSEVHSEADPQLISSLDELQLEFVDAGSASAPPRGASRSRPADEPERPAGPPQWHCEIFGEQLGPMSFSDLQLLVQNGEVGPDDRVRRENRDEWVPARSVGGLFDKDMLRWREEAAAERRSAQEKDAPQEAAQEPAEPAPQPAPPVAEEPAEPSGPPAPSGEVSDRLKKPKKRKRRTPAPSDADAKAAAKTAESTEPVQAAAASPMSPAVVQYYFRVDGVEHGPIEVDEFAKLHQHGRIKLGDEIREGEDGEWVPAARILNALRVAGLLGPVQAAPQPEAFPAGMPGGMPAGMPGGMGATGGQPAWTPPKSAGKKPKVKVEGPPLSERFEPLIEFVQQKTALVAILVIALLIVGVRYGWGLLGGSDDAATYRQIAEIYQQNKSGGGGDLGAKVQPLVKMLIENANARERAKQEMLWAARDYLQPMLGSKPEDAAQADEQFKTHMAVARQLIGDPSLPDLGGKVPEPEEPTDEDAPVVEEEELAVEEE